MNFFFCNFEKKFLVFIERRSTLHHVGKPSSWEISSSFVVANEIAVKLSGKPQHEFISVSDMFQFSVCVSLCSSRICSKLNHIV